MRWRRWRWARRRNMLPASLTVTNWGLKVSDKGMGDGIDLTALERIEVGAECFREVITVSISSDSRIHGMMNRPPKPYRNGVWIVRLFWWVLWAEPQHWHYWGEWKQLFQDEKWEGWTAIDVIDLPRLQVLRMEKNGFYMYYVVIDSDDCVTGWQIDVSVDIRRSSFFRSFEDRALCVKSVVCLW